MRISVEAANELSESKLKALIKQHGGIDAMPRMKVGMSRNISGTLEVVKYLCTYMYVHTNVYIDTYMYFFHVFACIFIYIYINIYLKIITLF